MSALKLKLLHRVLLNFLFVSLFHHNLHQLAQYVDALNLTLSAILCGNRIADSRKAAV